MLIGLTRYLNPVPTVYSENGDILPVTVVFIHCRYGTVGAALFLAQAFLTGGAGSLPIVNHCNCGDGQPLHIGVSMRVARHVLSVCDLPIMFGWNGLENIHQVNIV